MSNMEKFHLNLKDYERNVLKSWQKLQHDRDFCDITLAGWIFKRKVESCIRPLYRMTISIDLIVIPPNVEKGGRPISQYKVNANEI